jgi:hypothetical protein
MRGAKSLIVLVVVLAGLGGYIYFVESKKPEGGEAAEAKPKVFSVAADKIGEISVKSAGGEKTVVRKAGADWEIIEPAAVRADTGEVSGITSSLATLENARVVDESATDLKQYGLAEPRIDVGFKASGDKDFRHLLIGDKTATGGDVYAKVGSEKRVFLIAGYLEGSFNKSTFDLRDKTILKFDRDKVDRFQVDNGGQTVQLSQANGEWSLTKPVQAPADFGTVESMVGRLQSVQMKSVAAQDATDLKQYGLDKPELTAVLGMGSSQASFLIGKKADEATLYAKDASRPMVFTVEASLLDDLKKPVDQLRKKDLFTSRAYNTTGVEILRGTENVAFEKVKGQGKDATDKWRETRPAAKDVDAAKLETLLTKLSNLRAQSWADPKAKTGLDAPVLVVTIRFDEGKREEKVTFGKVGADVYATVAGQPGAARVDATEFDDATKAIDTVK